MILWVAVISCGIFEDTMIIVNTARAYFFGICANCPKLENKEINESVFHVIEAMEWRLCKFAFIATPFLEIYKSPWADGNIRTWETHLHIEQKSPAPDAMSYYYGSYCGGLGYGCGCGGLRGLGGAGEAADTAAAAHRAMEDMGFLAFTENEKDWCFGTLEF